MTSAASKRRRWRGSVVTLCALSLLCALAMAQEDGEDSGWQPDPELRGHVSFEAGLSPQGRAVSKATFEFAPEFRLELPGDMRLTSRLRFRGDPARDFADALIPAWGPTRPLQLGNRVEGQLREFYIERSVGDVYLKLGKQQIVWGVADGLKVLDVVNPQDYREFILEEFEDSRIPLWSAMAEAPIGDALLQVVWIPDRTYHILPRLDAPYEISAATPDYPDRLRIDLREPNRPDRFIADSDGGFRLSTFKGGWDLSFNYLYHYDDVPVLRRRYALVPFSPAVVVEPGYERSHLVGATFSTAVGSLTIRGEAGYMTGKHYPVDRILDWDGVEETDEISYVLGFDYFGWENTVASLQVFQSWLTNGGPRYVRDRLDTTVTLSVQRRFKNNTVLVEAMLLQSINNGDGLARAKVTYDVRDNLRIWVGLDVFYGTQNGYFGEFDENDRVTAGIRLSF